MVSRDTCPSHPMKPGGVWREDGPQQYLGGLVTDAEKEPHL